MRLSPLFLSLCLLLPVTSVSAADPAKVDELLEVTGVERNFSQMRQIIADAMAKAFHERAAARGLSAAQRDEAWKKMQPMRDEMLAMFEWEAMGPELRRIYEEELTDEEIDATLAYYRSPGGASMLAKQPRLMQRGAEIGEARAREVMARSQAQFDQAIADAAADEPAPVIVTQ